MLGFQTLSFRIALRDIEPRQHIPEFNKLTSSEEVSCMSLQNLWSPYRALSSCGALRHREVQYIH